MKRDPKSRNRIVLKVMWLMIIISATLLVPSAVSGKYRSEFSQTVDIVVYPAMTMEGVPVDGALINDLATDSSAVLATDSNAVVETDSNTVLETVNEIATASDAVTASPSQTTDSEIAPDNTSETAPEPTPETAPDSPPEIPSETTPATPSAA